MKTLISTPIPANATNAVDRMAMICMFPLNQLFPETELSCHDAFSAGTEPSTEVSKNAILVLKEQGYPTQGLTPKSIDDLFPGDFDLIISMGCGVSCPNVPIDHDWGLDDPVGGSIEIFRQTRDQILKLIQAIQPD